MATLLDRPSRVAVYVRVSSDSQVNGKATQMAQITTFLARNGWPPPLPEHVYEDTMTGRADMRKDERPGHRKMKQDALTHQFDAVVCWRLDRLARNPQNAHDWRDICQQGNISLVFVSDNWICDNSTMGQFMFGVLATSAQWWANVSKDNQRAGIEVAKKKGKYTGRKRKMEWVKIAKFYEAGNSWKACMDEFKISRAHLGNVLRAMKADRGNRPAGPPSRKGTKHPNPTPRRHLRLVSGGAARPPVEAENE